MWVVCLKGDKLCLENLTEKFSSYIKNKGNNYFIEYPKFNSLKTDVEVHLCAKKILRSLVGILRINGIHCNIDIASVTRIDINGMKHSNVYLKSVVTVIPLTESSISQQNYNVWLKCAEKDKNVKLALSFFGDINDENICFNIYKIFEIIKKDLKDKEKLRNIFESSNKELSNLTETLNALCGEKSRHPPNKNRQHKAMPLDIIEAIIKKGLKNWLNSKSKSYDD